MVFISSIPSMINQVAEHPAQVHFRVSGLEAALERGLDALLRFGVAYALPKQVGIAAEVLSGCERDGIDALLEYDKTRGRKPADPMSEGADEIADRVGG